MPAKPKPRVVSWRALLTPRQVRLARKLYKKGWSQIDIGIRFRVSQATISNLLRRVTYRNVKELAA